MLKKYTLIAIVLSLTACSSQIDKLADKYSKDNQKESITQLQGANAIALVTSLGAEFNLHRDLTGLTIDGHKMSLTLKNPHKEHKLNSSFFGVYSERLGNTNLITLASVGKLTQESDIPKEGKVIYQGKVFYGTNIRQANWDEGNSTFTADFANKTLDGGISIPSKQVTRTFPTAKISNNAFSTLAAGQAVEGNFFGKNAEELGGVWRNYSTDEAAIFGAAKQ